MSVGDFKSDLHLFDHAEISSQIIYVFFCFHNSKKYFCIAFEKYHEFLRIFIKRNDL